MLSAYQGFERGVATFYDLPDIPLLCFTGDFVSTTVGFDRVGLRRLLRRAADTAPTYAVLGNHDGGSWLARRGGNISTQPLRELIASAGIRYSTISPSWKVIFACSVSAITGAASSSLSAPLLK